MRAWLLDYFIRNSVNPIRFFRQAHLWRFERDPFNESVRIDVESFLSGNELPPYVVEYIEYLKEKVK